MDFFLNIIVLVYNIILCINNIPNVILLNNLRNLYGIFYDFQVNLHMYQNTYSTFVKLLNVIPFNISGIDYMIIYIKHHLSL